jgi:multidrug efflux pump subunit AcrA (membrane-fusion protein)
MVIIAILYVCAAWLVFFRFKLLPWNWPWRIVTGLLGLALLGVFVGLLNTLTPSGRIVVVGRVVEETPNVAGTVTSIPVEPNVLVKASAARIQLSRNSTLNSKTLNGNSNKLRSEQHPMAT